MKFDVMKLPLGELLVGSVLAAVVVTFVLAFTFGPGTNIEGGQAEEEVATDPAERGQQIATSFGCTACHSTTGEVIVGPSWLNVFGSTVTLNDGTEVQVDEAYVKESTQDPTAKVVQGFDALMPSFSTLTDADIQDIIAYMQSLSEEGAAETATPEATPTP